MNFDVRYNYWNSVNTDTLNAKIHDYFDDYNRGIANYQPFLKAPFSDTTAPAKPLNLAANGSNPSHGASDSTFIITWNNPPDPSGIAEYYYKLYTPPTSVFDTTAVFHHASPDTLKSQGGPLYVWLVDSSGNMDYHNDDSVLLNVSAVREQEKIAARPVFSLAIRSYSNGTMITYGIPERTAVSLTLYAVSGKLVKSIYTGVREKGYFTVDLKRNGFTAGTYLLRMKAGSRTTATRLMLN